MDTIIKGNHVPSEEEVNNNNENDHDTGSVDETSHNESPLLTHVLETVGPVWLIVFECLDWKTLFRLAKTSKNLRKIVKSAAGSSQHAIYGKPMGDEIVWQSRDILPHATIPNNADENNEPDYLNEDIFLLGEPRVAMGPTGQFDALKVSLMGQAVGVRNPVELGPDWTICTWTYCRGGQPWRPGFIQDEEWREGEHVLVGSFGDDQQVFYSENRRHWLGTFVDDDIGEEGFVASYISFQDVPDGWNHLAAVGRNGNDDSNSSTSFYLDGQKVGEIDFNHQTPVAYIGNVSAEVELSQPWGIIADFRIFRRILSECDLKMMWFEPRNVLVTTMKAEENYSWYENTMLCS